MARPASDIKPRIVDAARVRFLAEGVDGASLREIARDAKTNIGMVVYYFPTKDELFLAVLEEAYEKILRDLEGVLGGKGSATERLRGGFIRLGSASDHELEVIRMVAREALLSATRFKRILARFMRGHLPMLIGAVADGVRDGEFDASIPLPLLLLSVIGIGGLPQLVRRATKGAPPFGVLPEPEALADLTLGILVRAVGKREATTTAKRATRAPRDRVKPKTARSRSPRSTSS